MKETELTPRKDVETAIVQNRKKIQHLGSISLKPGQQLWEMDTNTGVVRKASFDMTAVDINGNGSKKIIVKPGHVYRAAINLKNAIRKFRILSHELKQKRNTH